MWRRRTRTVAPDNGVRAWLLDAAPLAESGDSSPAGAAHRSTRMSSIACEREDVRFMLVLQVARFVADSCTRERTPSAPFTWCSDSPSMYTPRSGSCHPQQSARGISVCN